MKLGIEGSLMLIKAKDGIRPALKRGVQRAESVARAFSARELPPRGYTIYERYELWVEHKEVVPGGGSRTITVAGLHTVVREVRGDRKTSFSVHLLPNTYNDNPDIEVWHRGAYWKRLHIYTQLRAGSWPSSQQRAVLRARQDSRRPPRSTPPRGLTSGP
jgi:hypothetical protein